MSMPRVFTNNSWTFTIVLKGEDKLPVDLSTSTAIKAVIASTNEDDTVAQSVIITANSGAPSADWSAGKVVLAFDVSDLTNVTTGTRYIEVQVTDAAGKTSTWPRVPILVRKGLI